MLKVAGQQGCEPLRQTQRLLVHEATEHDVRHRFKLRSYRSGYRRMVVTVARSPPRRNPVDQAAPIVEKYARTCGANCVVRLRRSLRLTVRQP
jgi:hypothetical protein